MLRNLAMQRPTDSQISGEAMATVGSGLLSAAGTAYTGYQQGQATDLANQRYDTEQAWRQSQFENQEAWRWRRHMQGLESDDGWGNYDG